MQINRVLQKAEALLDRLEVFIPQPLAAPKDWDIALAWQYRKQLNGSCNLSAVQQFAAIKLADLIEIEAQKQRLFNNTQQFVKGKLANNVLLTGARGTGKSSLIRACLAHFAPQGLRLIEVDKTNLADLPDIINVIANAPYHFILYCDDLSFDEGDQSYRMLKSVLDGAMTATTPNVVIYATSNRRHLLPEFISENRHGQHAPNGEIHPSESIEEKISLSERFGLWISFYPFNQEEYLAITQQWLKNMRCPDKLLDKALQEALVWALERGSRSGRVAYQFARDFVGRNA